MATPAEPEKYEVLKTIGERITKCLSKAADMGQGQGSFGVIRKVRRKSDGYVNLPQAYPTIIFEAHVAAGSLPKGNPLH